MATKKSAFQTIKITAPAANALMDIQGSLAVSVQECALMSLSSQHGAVSSKRHALNVAVASTLRLLFLATT